MKKIKINFRKGGSGARTSITLTSALIDTWICAVPGLKDEDWPTAEKALRKAIEETPEPLQGTTFQQQVEWFLLSDIRERLLSESFNAPKFTFKSDLPEQ